MQTRRPSIKHWISTFALSSAAFFVALDAYAQTFPGDAVWRPLLQNGTPMADMAGDGLTGRDIVGTATDSGASVYFHGDGSFAYFRLRVNDSVLQAAPSNFKSFAWVCLIDIDGDLQSYELAAALDGTADLVGLRQNTTPTNTGDPADVAETLLGAYPASTHAREAPANSLTSGTPDFFVDWAVPMADLASAGVGPSTPLKLVCGSSSSGASLTSDVVSTVGAGSIVGLAADPIACGALGCSYTCVGFGEPCAVGIGACAATGVFACNGTIPVCDATPPDPTPELCNGIDDDCNGSIDDGFDLGMPCSVGVGACAGTGVLICGSVDTTVCDVLVGPVTCAPADECHAEGTCDPQDGSCSYVSIREELSCASGICLEGACTTNPTCGPATEGVLCSDGNACTKGDTCKTGACSPGQAKVCTEAPECKLSICDPSSGECLTIPTPDQTPCQGGHCLAGACISTSGGGGGGSGSGSGSGGSGGAGGAGGSGSGGASGGGDVPGAPLGTPTLHGGGFSCSSSSRGARATWLAALGLLPFVRKRRSARF